MSLLFTTLLIDNKAKKILISKLKIFLENIKQYCNRLIVIVN